MTINDFKTGTQIKIVNVSHIRQGDMLWSDGDIVEIKAVEIGNEEGATRVDVWDKEKFLSEYIYPDEFKGIELVKG
ncbi:hypothetical protein P8825_14925 [Shouchella clausii]|uniref:hypothetical protein n=1 Tax=Shouchella clausii TaxID=79880 RepID=UPI002DBEA13F|nr:hypothetical protein [Shouchella clausii]MEB5480857.1 hypothetical protein [Shouchella clausii]